MKHLPCFSTLLLLSASPLSEAEKSLVTRLAADVRGTKSVTNDMTVSN